MSADLESSADDTMMLCFLRHHRRRQHKIEKMQRLQTRSILQCYVPERAVQNTNDPEIYFATMTFIYFWHQTACLAALYLSLFPDIHIHHPLEQPTVTRCQLIVPSLLCNCSSCPHYNDIVSLHGGRRTMRNAHYG